uniref:Cleavage and polyadenylation specificity factor subunit 4 n=1 Tax=Aotus nancymaae TaxID=37293 RepID=A0A2K5D8T0_AOTNA
VVCKHWLRGLCKQGDPCKFLHQCDLTRMPECCFYSAFGKALPGSADPSRHSLCPAGPLCKYHHVPRIMCLNYLVGFCPKGPKCQFAHLSTGPTFSTSRFCCGSLQAPIPESTSFSAWGSGVKGRAGVTGPLCQ